MKVTEHIANAKKTVFSFEILPPFGEGRRGQIKSIIRHNIETSLMEFRLRFIGCQLNYYFLWKSNVLLGRRKWVRWTKKSQHKSKEPGTVGIRAPNQKTDLTIDTRPHMYLRGFS